MLLRLLSYYKWITWICVTNFEIIYAALNIWFELGSRDNQTGRLEILCFSYTKNEVYIGTFGECHRSSLNKVF